MLHERPKSGYLKSTRLTKGILLSTYTSICRLSGFFKSAYSSSMNEQQNWITCMYYPPVFVCVIYINFIKEQFLCLNTYFAHDRIMQNMWYKNHDVIMMLLWWKCALLLVYKYMYFILLNLRHFLSSWLFLQVSSSKMKILGKGNNQYCLFVYQYYLFEFNELFSNPCKNSKESLNTTQFGEYLNN